jgi:hypothetical protein
MSLIQSGSPGNATIEETIGDLVQALDALCVINDIGRMNLSSGLQPKTADTIRLIADRAKEEMLILRRELSRNGQIEEVGILDKIISRQANVDTSANDFGISVTELCRRFGLLDADVMNAYYLSLPDAGLSWERLLSDVRGAVIHTGGLRVADRQAMQKWFAFIRHLHDICKRLILREVGYKGTYLATNARFTGMYEVDRIDSKTTVEQLGYTEPPTGV